jgi:hypothetical protein
VTIVSLCKTHRSSAERLAERDNKFVRFHNFLSRRSKKVTQESERFMNFNEHEFTFTSVAAAGSMANYETKSASQTCQLLSHGRKSHLHFDGKSRAS